MSDQTQYIESVQLTESGWLVNGNMSVPNDPGNRHYHDVQAWIAEGNTPTPTPAPPPPPIRYVRKKLILERLKAENLKDETLAALNSDAWLHEIWNAATEIDSEDPQVRTMIAAIGADPDEILKPE